MLPLIKMSGEANMEPIVLLGMIVVVYGGYVALLDLWSDLSLCFPRPAARVTWIYRNRGGDLKSPVKKMAGMHI